MGNHKLRLSNIIPNVWFYKLKAKTTTNNHNNNNRKSIRNHHQTTKAATNVDHSTPPPSPSLRRKSYHITRTLNPKPLRKTTKSSSSSSVSTTCSCATGTTTHSFIHHSKLASTSASSSLDNHCFDRMVASSWSSTSPAPVGDDDDDDVLLSVDKMSLPPIITEHKKFSELVTEIGAAEENQQKGISQKLRKQSKSPVRRISAASSRSPRVRIRINSPRLSKRVERSNGRLMKSVPESVAVVKLSADPERDFRESMVEMIVENEIRAPRELEELLASYLSLNCADHHQLIVHVFKQIWFRLNHIHSSY